MFEYIFNYIILTYLISNLFPNKLLIDFLIKITMNYLKVKQSYFNYCEY